LDIKRDLFTNSLIISMETTRDGELTITIPKNLIDEKIGKNTIFFVIVDGEESQYEETKTMAASILIIPFVNGNQEIEIVGTYYP